MATLQFASWATDLTYSSLTSSLLAADNKSFFNWAGCAIGGFPFQAVPQIALNTTLSAFSGLPTSSILGANDSASGVLGDAQTAALINGIASHVDDYDDTHLETIIYPAGPVASALLAVAEAHGPVTGHDFITAFVAGVEAEWSVGAAVGVSKLLGLNTTYMQHAIGITATQAVGMQVYFGSDTKSLHVGRAAQGGILAALLARNGYTSSLKALEAKYGWLHVVSTRENATALSIKDIDPVQLRVNPEVLILTGKKEPQTGLEGKFSIYHAAAVGLVYGEARPTQFTDAVVKDSTVISLRNKVTATEDEGVFPSKAYHVEYAKGSIQNPLTEEKLKEKFIDQVGAAIGLDRAVDVYASFSNVQEMSDVAAIRHTY
ncbi:hypothetical protein COCVIDRAFT_40423 [Bipolaris victoriae FI3]|uniref:MmgE/PrpD family protein n=1 Tax=Bipolaris victoriae (strain FI3) TaxID=930091 RepID=W7EI84_BIPV3|nr:hypothetical protein COCVIDRAFT_40423 [Bipolaris victoriae FI3]